MKRIVLAVVVALVALVLVSWPTAPHTPTRSTTTAPRASGSNAPAHPAGTVDPRAPRMRLDAAQAHGLRMRLDAAHTIASARRAAREASEVPAEAEEQEPFLDAMMAVRRCWPPDYDGEISLRFDFVDDPELGRFIDTPPITGDDDLPIDPALDDCIRDVVEEWHVASDQERSRSR